MYTYVGNNPLNGTDPSGLELQTTRNNDGSASVFNTENGLNYDIASIDDDDLSRLNAYAESRLVESLIDQAIIDYTNAYGTSNPEQAGNFVDPDQKYVYSEKGWVDLKHVLSASQLPAAGTGYPQALGIGMEILQTFAKIPGVENIPLVGPKIPGGSGDSVFRREDLRSNVIGELTGIRYRGQLQPAQYTLGRLAIGVIGHQTSPVTGHDAILAFWGTVR